MKEIKYEFEIEGITDILPHKFNGLKEEKQLKEESSEVQAKAHAYFHNNGNLAIPNEWIKGALIEEFYDSAGSNQKTKTKKEVAPRINIIPELIDLGIKSYEIDIRSAPSGGRRGGVRDFCTRPRIKMPWKAKGTLITTLNKTDDEWKRKFENTGRNQGIGSNRPWGFGRFKLNKFKRILD